MDLLRVGLIASILLFLSIFPARGFQQDSVTYDLQQDWLIYNPSLNAFAPFVKNSGENTSTVSMILNRENINNKNLILCIQEGTSLWVEQKIVNFYKSEDCKELNLDSLFGLYQQEDLFITIYHPTLDINKLATVLTVRDSPFSDDGATIRQSLLARPEATFKNFYTISLIILLVLMSVVYNLNPKNFREFWSISKTLNFKLRYENIHGLKVITWNNLLIIIIQCLTISYLLMVVFHLMGDPFFFLKTNIYSITNGIWRWIALGVLVFIFVIGKYILIKVLSGLMNLREIENIHFYEYLRISILIYNFALIGLAGFLFLNYQPFAKNYEWVVYVVAILSLIRIILLYLKFLRLSSFRNFYLFSYLCTTEILPFIIGLKIFVLSFIG